MDKPRIFLGSSGKQEKLLQALTRGLEDVAHVEPWTTSFNPGTTTLERLLELAREVDFAASCSLGTIGRPLTPAASTPPDRPGFAARQRRLRSRPLRRRPSACAGRSSSMRAARSFRRDLLGLTCVRYDDVTTAAEMRVINQKLRKAIEDEGRARPHRGPVVAVLPDGAQRSGAVRREPAADLARPRRRLEVTGRSWQEDGSLSARYWSEAAKERKDPSGIFYYWKGERPRDPNAPQLDGTGEIRIESADRAAGYFTTRVGRATRRSTRGRPASTGAPIPTT